MHSQAELCAAQERAAFPQAGSHGGVPGYPMATDMCRVLPLPPQLQLVFGCLCCLGCSWLVGGNRGVGEQGLGEESWGFALEGSCGLSFQ